MPHRSAIAPARLTLVIGVISSTSVALILVLLWVQRQQYEATIAWHRSRLGGVRLAIENFVKANGILPNVDNSNSVRVSWRVRLLPYIDSKEDEVSFSAYDESEEWNSAANIRLHSRPAPRIFRVNDDGFVNTTHIVILDSELIDEAATAGCAMFPIMESPIKQWIVAIPNLGLHWMSPDDRSAAAKFLRE